jgi:hypothetical protein
MLICAATRPQPGLSVSASPCAAPRPQSGSCASTPTRRRCATCASPLGSSLGLRRSSCRSDATSPRDLLDLERLKAEGLLQRGRGDADLDDALGLGDAEDDGDQFPGNAELDEAETI